MMQRIVPEATYKRRRDRLSHAESERTERLARVVAMAMGAECKVRHLDPRNEVKIAFSDHAKAQSIFGERDKVSLEKGIQSMTRWVKDHGSRASSVFEDIEIAKNMPNSWAEVMRTAAVQR